MSHERGKSVGERTPRRPAGTALRRGCRGALAVALFLAASGVPNAAVPQTAAETAALDAWTKLFGLLGGAASAPVTLTEAEAGALLSTPPIAPVLVEQGGLASVSVRFSPDEVHFSATAEPGALGAALSLPPGLAGAGPTPLTARVRLTSGDGFGEATLIEASASGFPLPPEAVADALLEHLLGAFSIEGSAARFPLPYGLRAIEVGAGEVRLTPGALAPGN